MTGNDREARVGSEAGLAAEEGGIDWMERARRLDARDPLARFRKEFARPAERIYLDGNSLGLLGRRAEASLWRAVDDWRNQAIGGWLDADPPWFGLAEDLGARVAPLVGAEGDEVVVTGSTTGNLHQLLATLDRPEGGRTQIVVDDLNFPSDRYAVASYLQLRGRDPARDLVVVPSRDAATIDEADLIAALTEDVSLLVVPTVVYRSGQLLDIARLAHVGRERGVMVVVDASHSVGAVPHEFDAWGVDAATWCSYKYLNGGPGAVAGLFLARRHWNRPPGLMGWFGMRKERQFDLGPDFEPAEGVGRLQVGTPPILSMAPLGGALETIHEAGIDAIRRKSLDLTSFLRAMAEAELAEFGVGCVTPREEARRGGHVALTHPEAGRVCRTLIDAGVVPDHRPPDIIRLAPAALSTSFEDVAEALTRLRAILAERRFEAYPRGRGLVS